MTHLIIVRGPPGSGKTTFAQEVCRAYPDFAHWETDQFFTAGGQYKYRPEALGAAIAWFDRRVEASMRKRERIVVAGCFTRRSSYRRLVKLALQHGYSHEVVVCDGEFECAHGVPQATIDAMRAAFEPEPEGCADAPTEDARETQRMAA